MSSVDDVEIPSSNSCMEGCPPEYTDDEMFQAYTHAKKLRQLMICHDRAVQQIVLLDARVADMARRHRTASRVRAKPHAVTLRMEERVYIYRWMREAYAEYRTMKWREVQTMISTMFNGLVPDMINNIIALAVSSRNPGDDGSQASEIEVSFVSDEDMLSSSDNSFVAFDNEDRDT